MADYSVIFSKLKISEDSLSLSSKNLYDYENRISSTVNGIPATIMNSLNIRNKLSTLSKKLEASAVGFENLSKGMSLINLKYQQTENVVVEGKAYLEKNKPDIFGDYKKQSIINGTNPRTIVNGGNGNLSSNGDATPGATITNGIYNMSGQNINGSISGTKSSNLNNYSDVESNDSKAKEEIISRSKLELEKKPFEGKPSYSDKDGNEITTGASDFYEPKFNILEEGWKYSYDDSLYQEALENRFGKGTISFGKYGASCALTGSLNITGNDTKNAFGLAGDGKFDAYFTLAELDLATNLIGDRQYGLELDSKVLMGDARVEAEVMVQVINDNKVFDPQFELKAGATVKAVGIEETAKFVIEDKEMLTGKLEAYYGAGVEADFAFRDGVIKAKLSGGAGLGGTIEVDVNYYDLIDYITKDPAKAAQDFWSFLESYF